MRHLAIAFLLLLPGFAQAHEGHDKSISDTASAMAKGAVHAAEAVAVSGATAVGTAARVAPRLDWVGLFKAAASSHLHNKIVHFPVALGLVGCLFLIMSSKFESLRPGARWLLFLAALSSIAAIISGGAQEDSVEGAAMKQVLEVHSGLGWATCVGLWLVWLLSFVESTKKWLWALLVVVGICIAVTGTLGGALAHMQF
jgi:uncharacterized membrane protein